MLRAASRARLTLCGMHISKDRPENRQPYGSFEPHVRQTGVYPRVLRHRLGDY